MTWVIFCSKFMPNHRILKGKMDKQKMQQARSVSTNKLPAFQTVFNNILTKTLSFWYKKEKRAGLFSQTALS
jgi:hypothetical protein